ncbi:MAG: 50S ribosome-binding GTPase, partial [Desulfobacterales bacterium]
MDQEQYNALRQLRDHIPRLAEMLRLGSDEDIGFWTNIVDAKLLSRLSPDFPLVAAICGGGSSGKSTLFNSILGESLAPTGGKAGMNRRVLFGIPAERNEQSSLIADLAEPFKTIPEPLHDKEELTVPGKPLFILNHSRLHGIVLLDTPDFDTGAQGAYTNREVTRMALEASDVLIYIFTNSNYNNRDSTDFIGQMLTGIGRRKCFLVYRVYPSFTDKEVTEHAMTVAHGIYGDMADDYLLGVYRTDEDNRVAAGEKFMEIRAVQPQQPVFQEALQAINAPGLRFSLYASILTDILQQADTILNQAQVSIDELTLYLDSLQTAQSHSVHEALKHFPVDIVMRRFARIWSTTDPSHIKIMRKTGSLIELPLKMLLGAAGWAKDQLSPGPPSRAATAEFAEKLDEDLVTAVTSLHYQAVSQQITTKGSMNDSVAKRMVETIERIRAIKGLKKTQSPQAEPSGEGTAITFLVDTHPVVYSEQQKLRNKDFKSVLQSITSRKDAISDISRDIEMDLKDLADQFRDSMGLWSKINQTFWALLNVLPATVAVTYVLSTGDPVGAAGIKVKLA